LLALPLAAACNEDSAPVDEDGDSSIDDGINSLDDSNDSTTDDPDSTGEPPTSTEGGSMEDVTGGDPSCMDGVFNQDETDVDCGGPTCEPCAAGFDCLEASDCIDGVCEDGACQEPSCYDDVHNGSEEGVDCGGNCPNACGVSGCQDDNDCEPGEFCLDGACMPSSCENDIVDTDETDVDCGGNDCPDCEDGLNCNVDDDCISEVCDAGVCLAPTCDDNEVNGTETDEDCGGDCPPCSNSSTCEFNSDCISGVCTDNNCAAPNCNDGVQNGNETDEDCGGNCEDCDNGDGCVSNADCVSGVCTMGACADPACDDGVQNGDETDEDCGGTCGDTCLPGSPCFSGADCLYHVCEFGLCSVPDCNDGVLNGMETDVDCGGNCGATCEEGEGCVDGGDCIEGVCDGIMCVAPSCDDSLENGDETDVDCGGVCGATCDTGENCLDDGDCIDGVCEGFTCQPPQCDDLVLNGDEVGVDCQGSCPNPCGVGGEVVVNTYTLDAQTQPAIAASPNGNYFVVVWTSSPVGSPAQDGSGSGVYAQIYDSAGGEFGNEFLVNSVTANNQGFASVAAFDTGFVVVWETPDSDSTGVSGRRFDTAGSPVGAQFQVNTSTTGPQRRPDVAADNTGAFVVCWDTNPVASFEIRCQRYSNAAVTQGGEIAVNTTAAGDQQLPSVGRQSNGNFTVAWQASNDQDGDGIGIFTRRFDSAGAAQTGEVEINQEDTGNQSGPALAMNANGAYVIAWSSDDQDGNATAVVARRYNNAGVAQGNEFIANTYTTGAQNVPAVGMNSNGDFMIAWQSANQDGSLTGVYAQRYDDLGATVGVEFRVNTTVVDLQDEPDLVIRGDEPAVVWTSGPVLDRDIVLQRFEGDFPP
jgi:hypothetical protein